MTGMPHSVAPGAYHDPSIWNTGQTPSAADAPRVLHRVTLEGAAQVASLSVGAGGELQFARDGTTTLESRGNVVVRGEVDGLTERIARLRMQPRDRSVVHTLLFPNVDETAFVGGGMQVLETDVGLWVDGPAAEVLIEGTSVGEAWNRVGHHDKWSEADELLVTPVAPGLYEPSPFRLGDAVPVLNWRGERLEAEVCNLTRNVRIEGSRTGHAHVMLNHVARRSVLRDVALAYLGIQDSGNHGRGRYALHIHHGGGGCAIERVVVRHSRGRGIVVHGTRAPTQVREALVLDCPIPYWWDPDTRWTYPANATHGLTYERCGAILYHGARGAFDLGQGEGNACIDCFAACGTHTLGGGFHWPAVANHMPNVWRFYGNRTHNTKGRGLFAWQNDHGFHEIAEFLAFNCDGSGILDGAYGQSYRYRAVRVFLCGHTGLRGKGGFEQHAGPVDWNPPAQQKEVRDGVLDCTPAISVERSNGPGNTPIPYVNCYLNDAAPVVHIEEKFWHEEWPVPPGVKAPNERHIDYVRCRVGDSERDLEPSDFEIVWMHPDSVHRIARRDGTCYQLHPDGTTSPLPNNSVGGGL